MDNDDGPGPLRARLGYLLKHAFFELEELHTVHLARCAVNVRELSVLLLLDGREPESQQQAAGRLGVDRTTMVGLLDGLEGKGLLARQTDPGWGPVFFMIRGLVLERGGMLSHGAIIAREFGIPAVVGVADATRRIAQGQKVSVDGDRGVVTILD